MEGLHQHQTSRYHIHGHFVYFFFKITFSVQSFVNFDLYQCPLNYEVKADEWHICKYSGNRFDQVGICETANIWVNIKVTSKSSLSLPRSTIIEKKCRKSHPGSEEIPRKWLFFTSIRFDCLFMHYISIPISAIHS